MYAMAIISDQIHKTKRSEISCLTLFAIVSHTLCKPSNNKYYYKEVLFVDVVIAYYVLKMA